MGVLAAGSGPSRLTHKRHAVSRDELCRIQESFSVAELFLLSPKLVADPKGGVTNQKYGQRNAHCHDDGEGKLHVGCPPSAHLEF